MLDTILYNKKYQVIFYELNILAHSLLYKQFVLSKIELNFEELFRGRRN